MQHFIGTSNKIPTELSEKIYGALVKLCGAKDDHYEKETFIYHHSIVNKPLEKYKFKGIHESMWEIDINEKQHRLKLTDIILCKSKNLYKTEALANKIIDGILHNEFDKRTLTRRFNI